MRVISPIGMRIEAKFIYIYIYWFAEKDPSASLSKSIDRHGQHCVSGVYLPGLLAYTRLILKVKLQPRLMLLLHARLFALPSPLNSNSSSVSYRISRGNLSTMWIVDRRPLIDTIGSIRERLRMAAERKKIDRLCCVTRHRRSYWRQRNGDTRYVY